LFDDAVNENGRINTDLRTGEFKDTRLLHTASGGVNPVTQSPE
jgi:hypothetical protein